MMKSVYSEGCAEMLWLFIQILIVVILILAGVAAFAIAISYILALIHS